jgi:type I restriction enzyme S subunit
MSAWPLAPLASVIQCRKEFVQIDDLSNYKRCRVQLHAQGIVLRDTVPGAEIKTKKQQVCKAGDFLVAEIDAKVGGFGIVPEELDQAIVSSHYFLFEVNEKFLNRRFLDFFIRTPAFREQVAAQGSTNYAAIRPGDVLGYKLPLPPLPEQQRIVTRIESLAPKIEEARGLREEVQKDLSRLLNAAYHQIADKAPRKPLGELAPLDRRPVTVDFEANYPQVAVRSFGRGTFHKPPLIGSEVTWEKPFLVKAGDILVSNIKAWEGAIAVAGADDDGRVGSHRYLTCVAKPGIATARFVCFHLLTSEGLYEVGEASPGSADRNRTLSAKAFMQIPVPIPEYEKQLWFDALYQKVNSIAKTQSESSPELAALLPSILDKAFKGEL